MTPKKIGILSMAFAAIATIFGPGDARADSCSASASAILSRSTGGTCPAALSLNQQFTFSYRVRNNSTVDGGPNDGNSVEATIPGGKQFVTTLAQATSGVVATALPGVLTFVPVCPVGSVGGSLAAGQQCNPNLSQCGTGVCGCDSALPGVTCSQSGDPNKIILNVTQDLVFNGGQQRTLATIRVRVTDLVDPPATCGLFFSRLDSTGDVMVTTDDLCDSLVSAGAQGSANLHAPECTVAGDCGDAQCNVCANVGTNNHCEAANTGNNCGTDANATDCLTPACVNQSGTGVCLQGQNNVGQGTECSNNSGVPVPDVQCQEPLCDAGGTCTNQADPSQNGDSCGTDGNLTDCVTPACLAGTCTQGQNDVGQGADCTNNGGVPVADVDCQEPLCDGAGACANAADPSQNGDACGTDGNLTDCVTPACLAGSCTQGQNDVGQGADCTNNGGVPVADVDCQEPLCDGTGTCANVADASQNGDDCGTDGNLTDCVTPACVSGNCTQGQNDVDEGELCTNNDGVPVPVIECQIRRCDDSGVCESEIDASQNGAPCSDSEPANCFNPQCANGACDQEAVCDPTESPSTCRVTISDTIFDDANQNGIQDGGEGGIAGVEVDVYTCNGNVLQVLEGSDTTDGSGNYSFSVATCDPSEVLAIDVSGNFAGTLSGYTESPAFCDAGDPGMCGAEITPAVDSNCINGISDCRTINRGSTDQTVDCGYSQPPSACEVDVTKEACVPQLPGEGCTGGALAVLLQWNGPGSLAAGTLVQLTGSSGANASGVLAASLDPGENLLLPGQNGFSIDAVASGATKLGSGLTLRINGVIQEVFHASCSCPDSYTTGGMTYFTNLVLNQPMCLDASSPDNPDDAKGYPSPLWTLVGLKDPEYGSVFSGASGECSNQLPPTTSGEACAIKDNKLTAVEFQYVGAEGKSTNCANKFAAFTNSQDKGKKLKCSGTAKDNQPVRVVVLAKDGNPVWFDSGAANVNLGDLITILAADGGKSEFEGDTMIRVFNGGGTKIEEITIHTHCHDRYVNVGDIYGGFEVIGTAGTKGGSLAGGSCPEVEYRYAITSASDMSVQVCDDQLGDLGVVALQAGVTEEFTATQQLTYVNGECTPLENTVRVFPDSVPCPDPADSVPPDDCGSATAVLLPAP